MSRKVALFLVVLVVSSMACAVTSSNTQPTPVVLLPTLSPSLTPTSITPTPTVTATTTANTGGNVNTGNPVCTPRSDWVTYIVVQGDTLGQIAERTGTTAQQLTAANCLSNANVISAGQPLRVPRQPSAPTATPRPASNVIDLNPSGDPPGNVCVVRNPNPGVPVQVYVDGPNNTLVPSQFRLVTWAPFVGVRDAWYQITIPNTGANWVAGSDTILAGATCPPSYVICTFTYSGSGRFVARSGAGANYPYSVELPGNTPLPVLARTDGWVQVGSDYSNAGWIETAAGELSGPCR